MGSISPTIELNRNETLTSEAFLSTAIHRGRKKTSAPERAGAKVGSLVSGMVA
jgi:hypothetical protein